MSGDTVAMIVTIWISCQASYLLESNKFHEDTSAMKVFIITWDSVAMRVTLLKLQFPLVRGDTVAIRHLDSAATSYIAGRYSDITQ
jgi:hypothetical protein